ncbi:MAG: hypothetical protein FJ398_25785 [Verrucomicrobia bacterium]|nr:hypothetical protein [Verrucomicrobiota bacterium]
MTFVRRWIGFNDEAKEGAWLWISGEPVTYINWLNGEPNNSGDEDFAVINFDDLGKWNDLKAADADTSSAIIERVPGVAQTPIDNPATSAAIYNFSVAAGNSGHLGSQDGVGSNARFNGPSGLCVDAADPMRVRFLRSDNRPN